MGNGLAKLTPCISVVDDGRTATSPSSTSPSPTTASATHSATSLPTPPPTSPPTRRPRKAAGPSSPSSVQPSAQTSRPHSRRLRICSELTCSSAASFESSHSCASVLLQPLPNYSASLLGPLSGLISDHVPERAVMSGPFLDRVSASHSSSSSSISNRLSDHRRASRRALPPQCRQPVLPPWPYPRRRPYRLHCLQAPQQPRPPPLPPPSHMKPKPSGAEEPYFAEVHSASVKWAQGKAGKDRVHLVVLEKHGRVFVGTYDGFNGPHATDYLLSNL